jgi:hypothetical protein
MSEDKPLSLAAQYRLVSEALEEEYGEQVQAALNEIGYVYVGERRQICRENPKEPMRRFKLHHLSTIFSWGIMLWHGTSEFIPCEPSPRPTREEDFGPYTSATNDQDTQINLRVSFEEGDPQRPYIEVSVWDDGKLLPPHFDKSHPTFSSMQDVIDYLQLIKDTIR